MKERATSASRAVAQAGVPSVPSNRRAEGPTGGGVPRKGGLSGWLGGLKS